MKLTQNTIIHIVLGVAVLTTIALFYLLLAHDHSTPLSTLEWSIFGGASLAVALAAFVPSLVRRLRHQPPPAILSASDIRYWGFIAIAGSALAVFGVLSEMWWLMALGIMLAPLTSVFHQATPPPNGATR